MNGLSTLYGLILYNSFIPFSIKIIFVTLLLLCLLKKYFQGPNFYIYSDSSYWCLANTNTVTKTNSIRSCEEENGRGIRLIKIFILRKLRKTSTYGFGFDRQVKMMQLPLYNISLTIRLLLVYFNRIYKRTLSSTAIAIKLSKYYLFYWIFFSRSNKRAGHPRCNDAVEC